ncbi:MAG TPA: DUF6531 domain-containing protein [Candidatus Hydrogenedentes bacterium]|nr:DUF6531 domain-containing protein [Candidatus Hydrogenedentota bacterium]
MIVRSLGQILNWRPENGRSYAAGEAISSAIQVIAQGTGLSLLFDQDVINDTKYYYRVYAITSSLDYSWGVPIEATPSARVTGHYYRLEHEWGGPGTAPGQFAPDYGPTAIEVLPDDKSVIVADFAARRIQRFSPDGALIQEHWEQSWCCGSGWELRDFKYSPVGRNNGNVVGPRVGFLFTYSMPDVAYVHINHQLCLYNLSGNTVDRFCPPEAICEGQWLPSPECWMYGSLTPVKRRYKSWNIDNWLYPMRINQCVFECNAIADSWSTPTWGIAGSGAGQLDAPVSVVQGPDLYVYTGDYSDLTGRIQKFTLGGVFVQQVAHLGFPEVPMDMDVDKYGNFYVLASDMIESRTTRNHKVYKFDKDWNYLTGFLVEREQRAIGELTQPGRITVDDEERVYVTARSSYTVKVFAPSDANGTSIPFNAYAGEPVNTYTGRYVYEHTDLEVSDVGLPFKLARTYNSGDTYFDVLGPGWRHSYGVRISQPRVNAVVVHWGDGHDVIYEDWGNGYEPVLPGTYEIVTKEADDTYRVTTKEQAVYVFDVQGRLVSIIDKNSNIITLNYDNFKRLASIVHPSGRVYQLSYHPSGLLANLQDPLSRQVTYGYDIEGNLSQVSDAEGHTTTFIYDVNGWITQVTDPLGHATVQNTYENPLPGEVVPNVGKVTRQKNASDYETLFAYDGDRTIVTDQLGYAITYDYDSLGRMILQTDPDALRTQFEYDVNNNRTKVTDRNGNVTQYEYDEHGNMTRKTDAAGNTVIITYNAQNQPLSKTDEAGATTQFEYDEHGNLMKTTDALGREWMRSYDSRGLLLSETDPLGYSTSNEYSPEGNLLRSVDRNGHATTYTYDAAGRKLAETNALNLTTSFIYNNNDKLLSMTDALGRMTQHEYDANGNRTRIVYPDGNAITSAYDENDRLLSETDELGWQTIFEYDAAGRKTKTTDPLGHFSQYAYDAMGRLINEIDKNSHTWQYQYDGNGNRTKVIDPLARETDSVFDSLNRNTSITDHQGHITSMSYDALGHLIAQTAPDGGTTQHSYNALGEKTTDTDPLGNVTQFRYDAAGRLVEEENAQNKITHYEYDAVGNRTKATDPLGNATQFVYDALNRQIQTIDPLGNISATQYDAGGRKIVVIDALNRMTRYDYDTRDRLTSVTDALGGITRYSYDAAGNMITFTNARGKAWAYAYDALNRRISETTPLEDIDQYAYDAMGNRISHTGPDSQTTMYAYDAADQLTDVNYPDALHVQYTYDGAGRRISMTDSVGITAFSYDAVGRITQTTDPFGKILGYTYDLAGNRTGITYPDSTQVAYSYDVLNRMATVNDWASNTTTYAYDAAGRLIQETAPNGVVTTYAYDSASRLTHKKIAKSGGEVIAEYDLTLDAIGNRKKIDILAQPVMPPPPNTEDTASQYDAADRILTAGTNTYTFDSRGRMTSKTSPEGTTNFAFDYRDRLTQVTSPDRTDAYLYEGNGNRVQSTYGSAMTRYVLDLTRDMTWVLCETDESGTITAKYVYGNGLLSTQRGATMSFYHYDQLGNTVAVSDADADISSAYAYDEFGKTTMQSGTEINCFQYVGQLGVQQEANTLLFMRARFYDTSLGLFLSPDSMRVVPEEPLAGNSYSYVIGNPLLLVDASGKFAFRASVLPELLGGYLGLTWVQAFPGPLFDSPFVMELGNEESKESFRDLSMTETSNDPSSTFGVGASVSLMNWWAEAWMRPPSLGGENFFVTSIDVFNVALDFYQDESWGGELVMIRLNAGIGLGSAFSTKFESLSPSKRLIDKYKSEQAKQLREIAVRSSQGLTPRQTALTSAREVRTFSGKDSVRMIFPAQYGTSLRLRIRPSEKIESITNTPVIFERYEPKYRLVNKPQLKDME